MNINKKRKIKIKKSCKKQGLLEITKHNIVSIMKKRQKNIFIRINFFYIVTIIATAKKKKINKICAIMPLSGFS